ncbi:MAG: RNA polymerase sigma factor [Actinomycetota bacterium]
MLGQRFASILEAARRGEDSAWAEIYRDLAPSVLGYLRARGAREPEDLVGEVFIDLVRDLSRFQGGERDFRAWVFAVARNNHIDDVRKRGRRPVEPVAEEELEATGPVGNAEEQALDAIAIGDVRQALARLTPDQREVLALRVFGDLTVAEVARIVRKREGAVKALQRRALAAILRELPPYP